MRALVQRVSTASVVIGSEPVASIDFGLCVFVAVHNSDTEESADKLCQKILALRVFGDETGRMNRSVTDCGGEVLCVSQFTLYGDTARGNRPSYVEAAAPQLAEPLYERVCDNLRARRGRFGAHMAVSLTNDGPVTLLVET